MNYDTFLKGLSLSLSFSNLLLPKIKATQTPTLSKFLLEKDLMVILLNGKHQVQKEPTKQVTDKRLVQTTTCGKKTWCMTWM